MSAQIKEALAGLDHLPGQTAGAPKCCVYAHTTVRAALESAQREAVAWEAIEAWVKGGRDENGDSDRECVLCTPDVLLAFQLRAGCLDDEGGYEAYTAHGKDRLEALEVAAKWCRAEMAK